MVGASYRACDCARKVNTNANTLLVASRLWGFTYSPPPVRGNHYCLLGARSESLIHRSIDPWALEASESQRITRVLPGSYVNYAN